MSRTSFNPCSLGCCSESRDYRIVDVQKQTVSILVLLDVALKVTDPSGNEIANVFQSLFSWMLL